MTRLDLLRPYTRKQKTVKGVVVESYNAEILSESRRLVANIESVLGVALHSLGNEVNRLAAIVLFCVDDTNDVTLEGMGGLSELLDTLERQWDAERATLTSGEPFSQRLKFAVALLCVAELQSVLNMLVEFLDEISEQLSFWKGLRERRVRYAAIRLVTSEKTGAFSTFANVVRLACECCRAIRGDDGRATAPPRRSLRNVVRHLENVMGSYLEQLGKVKHALIAIDCAETENELEIALTMGFKITETIMGVSVLRDSALSSPRHGANSTTPSQRSFSMSKSTSHDTFFAGDLCGPLFQHEVLDLVFEHTAEVLDTHDPKCVAFQRRVSDSAVPGRVILYWPELFMGTTAAFAASVFLVRNSPLCGSDNLSRWVSVFSVSVKEFGEKHVTKPIRALIDEVFFDTVIDVADQRAVEDAKASLSRMLKHYVEDHNNQNFSKAELIEAIEACDMRIITDDFEREMQKPVLNLVSGDLVRLMLLNVQFLKKEMLSVVAALDTLIRQNQFNLQAAAMVPAFFMMWLVYAGGKGVYRAVRGTRTTTGNILRRLRFLLRDCDQVLNLERGSQSSEMNNARLGKLVLLMHQMEVILHRHWKCFDRHERKRLQEDLHELISSRLSIQQRLGVINRMYRTYGFLKPNYSRHPLVRLLAGTS